MINTKYSVSRGVVIFSVGLLIIGTALILIASHTVDLNEIFRPSRVSRPAVLNPNLKRDFSDHDGLPLKLYLKALKSGDPIAIYEEILDKYPDCKLAPIAQYLKASYFHSRFMKSRDKALADKAIESYKLLEQKYPDHHLPDIDYPEHWHRDPGRDYYVIYIDHHFPFSDIAKFNIAWLEELKGELALAISAYENIAQNLNKTVDVSKSEKANVGATAALMLCKRYSTLGKYEDLKRTAEHILKNMQDMSIIVFDAKEWRYHGDELHPEALLYLAAASDSLGDKKTALASLKRVMVEYPGTYTGHPDSEGISYCEIAINRAEKTTDPASAIGFFRGVIGDVKKLKDKEAIQFRIAEIYDNKLHDSKTALIEYKKVLDIDPAEDEAPDEVYAYYSFDYRARQRIKALEK